MTWELFKHLDFFILTHFLEEYINVKMPTSCVVQNEGKGAFATTLCFTLHPHLVAQFDEYQTMVYAVRKLG